MHGALDEDGADHVEEADGHKKRDEAVAERELRAELVRDQLEDGHARLRAAVAEAAAEDGEHGARHRVEVARDELILLLPSAKQLAEDEGDDVHDDDEEHQGPQQGGHAADHPAEHGLYIYIYIYRERERVIERERK